MGMYDEIKIKQNLSIPEDLKSLNINWKEYNFQTKDLDNCLSEYFISEDGFLYEHIIEREYIPYTEEEKKDKNHKSWNLWKDIIEKGSEDKKIDFHGTLIFYTYDQLDEDTDFWIEFKSYFVYGKLDKIELLDFKLDKDRKVKDEKWKDAYKKLQNHPWTIFRRYASYLGWRWFWKKIINLLYLISTVSNNIRMFIIKNIL